MTDQNRHDSVNQRRMTCPSRGLGMAALAVSILGGTGCASTPPQSGFLGDYSNFTRIEADARVWDYVDPSGIRRATFHPEVWADRQNWERLGQYDRVMIDALVVQMQPSAEGFGGDVARVQELVRNARARLVAQMEERYTVVEQPGPGVVRFRGALTKADPAYLYPRQNWNEPMIWANSLPGEVIFEAEAVDAETGDRIVGLIASVRGNRMDLLDETDAWAHVERTPAGFAKFMRTVMDTAHGEERAAPADVPKE